MRLFSFLYIAASHTARVHYFLVVLSSIYIYIHFIVNCRIYYFPEHVTFDILLTLKMSGNVVKRNEFGLGRPDNSVIQKLYTVINNYLLRKVISLKIVQVLNFVFIINLFYFLFFNLLCVVIVFNCGHK